MTEYFEVLDRDGAARRGELRLEPPLSTPALVDDVRHDAGSLWVADREVPPAPDDRLTIFPHRGMPTGTREEVQEAFTPPAPDVDGPTASVIAPETAAERGTDAYVLSGIGGLTGDGRRLAEAVMATRRAIPDDAALYAPGVATPSLLPWLCYAGVDLVDTDATAVAGTRERYQTRQRTHDLGDLDELPCACEACRGRDPAELSRDDVVDHNVATLEATLAQVRTAIDGGRLRDLLEGQVRHQPRLTVAMRVMDQEWDYLEERTPVVRHAEMHFTTEDALRRVEVLRFAERVTERFRARLDDRPLVLVPCSATKPYSESPSHADFREAIDYRGHVVSLSSPIGVVPDELELTYPAQHYDTAVTGRWSAEERRQVADVLDAYLDGTRYPAVVAHVPEAGYRPVVERALEGHGDLEVTYTVSDHPRDDDALAALADALEDRMRYPRARRYDAIVKGIADYQFGAGAGDDLFDRPTVEGRYPRLRVVEDGRQLATLVYQFGHLALTLEGADRLMSAFDAPPTVRIDDFVPHGSVLAPGVVDADAGIRVGDEVVVDGPGAIGVGRATMAGPAMAESTRGVAVDVRHVRER